MSVAPRASPGALLLAAILAGCAAPGGRELAPVEERGFGARAPAGAPAPPPARAGIGTGTRGPGATRRGRAPDASAPDASAPVAPAGDGGPAAADLALDPARHRPAPVAALVEEARRELTAGRHDRAAAALERALRIDPDDGWLWHELAAVRLAQGRTGQARAMAARSDSLAGGDRRLREANRRLAAAAPGAAP